MPRKDKTLKLNHTVVSAWRYLINIGEFHLIKPNIFLDLLEKVGLPAKTLAGCRPFRHSVFLNTQEKASVFENSPLHVDGPQRFENATCGRRFYSENMEEKSPFSKIPRYVWPVEYADSKTLRVDAGFSKYTLFFITNFIRTPRLRFSKN